ncbi:MAG: hypothetical protein WCE94_01230 [Candidatus Methanoperedens sp.]
MKKNKSHQGGENINPIGEAAEGAKGLVIIVVCLIVVGLLLKVAFAIF